MSCLVLKAVLRPEGQLAVQVPHWMQRLIFSPPALATSSANPLSNSSSFKGFLGVSAMALASMMMIEK
jgi:hypothetical protein